MYYTRRNNHLYDLEVTSNKFNGLYRNFKQRKQTEKLNIETGSWELCAHPRIDLKRLGSSNEFLKDYILYELEAGCSSVAQRTLKSLLEEVELEILKETPIRKDV